MQRARPLLPFSWWLAKASNRAKKLLVKRQNIFQKIPTNIVKKLKLLPKDKLKWPWLIGGPGKIFSFSLKIAVFLINFISIFISFFILFINFISMKMQFSYQFSGWAKSGACQLLWAQRPNRKTAVVFQGSNPRAAGSDPGSPKIPKRGPLCCENAGKWK